MIRAVLSSAVLSAILAAPALAQDPTDAQLQERARRVMQRTPLATEALDLGPAPLSH